MTHIQKKKNLQKTPISIDYYTVISTIQSHVWESTHINNIIKY